MRTMEVTLQRFPSMPVRDAAADRRQTHMKILQREFRLKWGPRAGWPPQDAARSEAAVGVIPGWLFWSASSLQSGDFPEKGQIRRAVEVYPDVS